MYVVCMCIYRGEFVSNSVQNLHQGLINMQRLFFNELGWTQLLCSSLFLFDISLQLPLHPRVWTERIIHDKVIQDLHPRCVLRQVIIILSCYFLHLETKSKDQILDGLVDFR